MRAQDMKKEIDRLSGELVTARATQDKALALLRALIADVDAMKAQAPRDYATQGEQDHWYGGFSNVGYEGDYNEEVKFQWPNLGLLIEQARKIV